MSNDSKRMSEKMMISFASTLFSNSAANWYFTLVKNWQDRRTFDKFVTAARAVYFCVDYAHRARYKLCLVKQKSLFQRISMSFATFY